MKNKKYFKFLLGVIILISSIFFSEQISFAQENFKEESSFAFEKEVSIYPTEIKQEQYYAKVENDLGGSFMIYNEEPNFHGDIYYEVSLVGIIDSNKSKNDNNNQIVIYSEFLDNNPIKFEKSTQKSFSFSIPKPKNLKEGSYYFGVNLYNLGGELISSAVSDDLVDLQANGKFILLDSDGVSDGKTFNYTASTDSQEGLNFNVIVQVKKNSCFGTVIKDFKEEGIAGLSTEEAIDASVGFGLLEDGIYCAELQLEDDEGVVVSNKLISNFIVGDPSFSIQSINPNSLSYEKGNEAIFEVLLANPIPDQELEGSSNFGRLKTTLLNESGSKKINEAETDVFIPGVKRSYEVAIPIDNNLSKYHLSVDLFDKDNNLVDNQIFKSFNENQNEIEMIFVTGSEEDKGEKNVSTDEVKKNIGLVIGLVVGILVLIIAILFLIKKIIKRKNKNINTLIVFILAGLFMAFFSHSANAATIRVCVTGKIYDDGYSTQSLSGAEVYYAGGLRGYTTGSSGCYTESGLPAGKYVDDLQVKYPGSKTIYMNTAPIKYDFKDSVKKTNFTLSDFYITTINFELEAELGSVKFQTTKCDDGSVVSNASIMYGATFVGETNSSGYLTLASNSLYPGLYHSVFAKKTGLINSDSEEVPISSNETFWGGNSKLCLKPNSGTASGKVTVCGTSQAISGAYLYSDGVQQTAWGTTNSSGDYSFDNITPGTYENVWFGGVDGFTISDKKSVTINAGSNTATDFCLNPLLGSFNYSWDPVAGEILSNAGLMDYNFYVNNNTFTEIDNATLEFLFDGNVINTQSVSVAPMTNRTFTNQYSIAGKTGVHSVGVKVLWKGVTQINEVRNITIKNPGYLQGKVKDAKTGVGIDSNINISGNDYPTNADGTFNIPLAVGSYSGVYSHAAGFENSASKSFFITEGGTIGQDFLMNRLTGGLNVQVLNGTNPVSGADVYWGGYPDGPDYFLGTTNASGWLNVVDLYVGTYTGVYAKNGSRESLPKTVIINTNTTTEIDLPLTINTCSPIPCKPADQICIGETCDDGCGSITVGSKEPVYIKTCLPNGTVCSEDNCGETITTGTCMQVSLNGCGIISQSATGCTSDCKETCPPCKKEINSWVERAP